VSARPDAWSFKQVIVVRRDLRMGTGKVAAQVAHAAVAAVERVARGHRDWLAGWWADGQPKVVLQVPGAPELDEVGARAGRAGLPVTVVYDRGLTQVPAGTATCLAIGPAPADAIDAVTGDLRLL